MEGDEEYLIAPARSEVNRMTKTGYRWIILTSFSIFSLLQNTIWDTWGPISPAATAVFGFTEHDYYLLSNWSSIALLTTMPPFIWLTSKYGARLPVVASSFLVALGAGVRCLPVMGLSRRILIHLGQFLNALAGCAALGLAPLISNTWFPFSERILATSIMICVGTTGNALSYAIGPFVVDSPTKCSTSNSTTMAPDVTPQSTLNKNTLAPYFYASNSCVNNTDVMRKQLEYYLYGEFAIGAITFFVALFLFQNKPNSAPSMSAAKGRLTILNGLKCLFKNRSYWAVVMSLAINQGTFYGWYGIITVLLNPHGISEKNIAVAVLSMSAFGLICGVAMGFLTDRMKGRHKWILFVCYIGMFVVYLYLITIIMGWFESIKFTYGGFMASFIVLGALTYVLPPVALELAADIAYPVDEGVSAPIAAWWMTFFMFIYLLILNAVPTDSGDIASYLFLGFTAVSAVILLAASGSRGTRSAVDDNRLQNDQLSHDSSREQAAEGLNVEHDESE